MFSFGCLQAVQLNRFSDEQKKPAQSSPAPSVRHTGTACPGLLFAVLGHAPVDSDPLPGCCRLIIVWAKKLCERGKRLEKAFVIPGRICCLVGNVISLIQLNLFSPLISSHLGRRT